MTNHQTIKTVLLTIAIAVLQLQVEVRAEPKSAPPFRAVKGLFDSSNLQTLGLPRIQGEHTQLYYAPEDGYKFCHHPNLVVFKDRLYCMWSNGKVSEDAPGQRILFCHTDDGVKWKSPVELTNAGNDRICVASGFRVFGDQLIAFYVITGGSNFDPKTAVFARTSKNGRTWADPVKVTSGFFIEAPSKAPNGQLIYGGEVVGKQRSSRRIRILTTSDPSGLGDWLESSIAVPNLKLFGYTEPSFFRRADGLLAVTLRNYSGFLFGSISADNGKSWSEPIQTNFPDTTARTSAGNLPNGTVYLINNSLPQRRNRSLLTIALSKDGEKFDKAYVLRNKPTKRRYDGKHKSNGWQYPNAISWKDHFYVAYSINKEDVAITRVYQSRLVR